MAKSLTRWQLIEILRLLETGGGRRKVARLAGHARGTIDQIAHGQHVLQLQPAPVDVEELPEEPDPWDRPRERCPGCGRKIVMPCQACVAEAHRILSRFAGRLKRLLDGQPLGLDLKPADQERYEQLRARRDAGLPPLGQ